VQFVHIDVYRGAGSFQAKCGRAATILPPF
jgi:hypothetical protein